MTRWILGLIAIASLTAAQEAAPDLILSNGKIITVDERFSIAQAIAIRGDGSPQSAPTPTSSVWLSRRRGASISADSR